MIKEDPEQHLKDKQCEVINQSTLSSSSRFNQGRLEWLHLLKA